MRRSREGEIEQKKNIQNKTNHRQKQNRQNSSKSKQ